ncbi:putative histone chaperone domain chz [Podospora australis]|uniref:Histone chaperone domain chz n=1 Tax=Podospora australis TaxID=1536484 RepID=A0AAN6WK47_9PEZI|nr:putative histone chaperone domain chz [Podospora australis]
MASNGATDPTSQTGAAEQTDFKGKGKAVGEKPVEDTSMVDDDDDDEEDDEVEEEAEAAEEEDNLEEIDLENVIGRRTRGKVIDFAKAAEENPPEDDEDEDEDEDFEAEDETMEDA